MFKIHSVFALLVLNFMDVFIGLLFVYRRLLNAKTREIRTREPSKKKNSYKTVRTKVINSIHCMRLFESVFGWSTAGTIRIGSDSDADF